MGGSIGLFGHLMPKLSDVTRTCAVNPPGIGWSLESTSTAKEDAARFLDVIRTEYYQLGLEPKKAHTMLIGHSRGLSISHYLREFTPNLGELKARTYDVGIDGFPSKNWAPTTRESISGFWGIPSRGMSDSEPKGLASVVYVFRGLLSLAWPPFMRLNLG